MEKPAVTRVPIHDLIARRWSPVAFDPKPVSDEDLLACFEAARWSASCFNEQPWRYFLATREDAEAHAVLVGCLVPFNQEWAREAHALMLVAASTRFARNDKPNAHAWYDAGQATAQLVLEATARGLVAHQMAGFDADKARAACALPDDHDPIAFLALGYPGDAGQLAENLAKRDAAPRERRPLAAQVHRLVPGEPHPLTRESS